MRKRTRREKDLDLLKAGPPEGVIWGLRRLVTGADSSCISREFLIMLVIMHSLWTREVSDSYRLKHDNAAADARNQYATTLQRSIAERYLRLRCFWFKSSNLKALVASSFCLLTFYKTRFLFVESEVPDNVVRKLMSPRQQVFMELLQTESNYVGILQTIVTVSPSELLYDWYLFYYYQTWFFNLCFVFQMFKQPLEEMAEEDYSNGKNQALLNNTELKNIFGNLPPIYELHQWVYVYHVLLFNQFVQMSKWIWTL